MELNFLTMADSAADLQPLRQVLAGFERETELYLVLGGVSWERAWQTRLMDAMEGKGPHVSQIGFTWVATMAMLDALRAFSREDVFLVGGPARYPPAAWESVKLGDRLEVWAIPWSLYTFVLYYRRDDLQRARVDPLAAFATPAAIRETFVALQRDGTAPWAFPGLHPYADLVHIASSWTWANGGDFMSLNDREPLFARPEASAGLMDFFELFPFIPPALRGLNVKAGTNAFARGDTAVLIGGVEFGNGLMSNPYATPARRENIAVTTLPGVPWIGGDRLVIWDDVLVQAASEKTALELVSFLSRRETQAELYQLEGLLPARIDCYGDLTFAMDTTAATQRAVLKTGRPHPALRLWRRIEAFLDEMLLDIGVAVLRQPTSSPSERAVQRLEGYAGKLSAVLKG